jgi:hypothetical protein
MGGAASNYLAIQVQQKLAQLNVLLFNMPARVELTVNKRGIYNSNSFKATHA